MRALDHYDYAVVRVVPRADREEFVNVGVVLSCQSADVLACAFEPDPMRLRVIDPAIDLELVARHLDAFRRICEGAADAGAIAAMPRRRRFEWLTARRSALIRTSAVHVGRCPARAGVVDATGLLSHLLDRMVRVAPAP